MMLGFYFMLVGDIVFTLLTSIRCLLFQSRRHRLYILLPKLGPIWIKIGQTLAHNRSSFPPHVIKQFERLTNDVPCKHIHIPREILPHGLTIDERNVLGSGCVAQTYAGKYKGKHVVVKVTRPGIRNRVVMNLATFKILLNILSLLSCTFESIRNSFDLESFEVRMIEQTNLLTEARNCRKFGKSLSQFTDMYTLPKVYYSSERVLVMERFQGIKFNKFCKKHPKLKDELVDSFNLLYKIMVFKTGIIHGDLHQGNYFVVLRNGKPVLQIFDLGIVIYITKKEIRAINNLFFMTFLFDGDGLMKIIKMYNGYESRAFIKCFTQENIKSLRMTRKFKTQLSLCLGGTASVDDYVSMQKCREKIVKYSMRPAELFSLMYKHNVYLPGDLIWIIGDLCRAIELSVLSQSKNNANCTQRAMVIAIERNILLKQYKDQIGSLKLLMSTSQVETKQDNYY